MANSHNTRTARGDRISCSSDIAIQVKNGRAIISGTACSSEEVQQAEAAVYTMSGVNKVYNLVKTGAE